MATGRFISYLRVSTDKQGEFGLGMDAQRRAVADYLNGGQWELIAEYTEVVSGRQDDRAQLVAALEHCKRVGSTLLIAKLDRLGRSVAFIAKLIASKVPFVCCDRPHAKAFELHIYAAMAEEEARMISERVKVALAATKARGTKLGGFRAASAAAVSANAQARAEQASRALQDARAAGCSSLRQIAAHMAANGSTTASGAEWTAIAVSRLINRLEREAA